MAQQAKQAAQKLSGMFPKGAGKGLGGAAGVIIALGALGYGVNASLFNGNISNPSFSRTCAIALTWSAFYNNSRWWSQSYQVYSSVWCSEYRVQ